jgi:hypothetical protein
LPGKGLGVQFHSCFALDSTAALWSNPENLPKIPMRRVVPKTELAPENGCIIDTKWKVGHLSYHACAKEHGESPANVHNAPMPELVVFDHIGFKGASARTNLSFHYLGDFWNDRISSLIVVSGVWRFYRDEYYKGDHWDLGPGFYESFFKDKGPDDVISSFQAIALT